ncbi:UDP-glycosyltransferase 71K2 [Ziziphus jujuba]|uniref:Glycosyltransferase n=1 Tax=Ziziphus jujuba TaxID=326968 RepID=A0A6P4A4Q6_ZIZJJ|nr:UDP-glycosyltransferase 71K2 [Ziziphus jujuba]
MKKINLVVIPFAGVGHLVSTIEFIKRLLSRDDRFSVTILVIKSPLEHSLDPNTSPPSLPSSHPHIQFINVRSLNPPPIEVFLKSPEKYFTLYIESYKLKVKEIIVDHVLPNSAPLGGLFLDMFSTSMVDVAQELGVPSYVFLTSGAGFLGFVLYLQTRHDRGGAEFELSDIESYIPSYVNPVPSRVLPSLAFNREGGYVSFVNVARNMKKTKGIIVNTVFELESHAISSLLMDGATPPVYAVGPLIDHKGESHFRTDQAKRDKIIKWLDDQPTKSVIFLCFGSFGSFGVPQLREIAIGLEQSGARFLWSIRQAKSIFEMPIECEKPEEFLPQGFLDRTKELGMICGWTPQIEVLAHRAIGGFVSHCGWNSILESLWHGVPIITWPLYAEQQINAFQIVKDLGLGVELRLDYRRDGGDVDVVMRDEIEKAVRFVMDGDSEVRQRVQEASEKCRKAVVEGGSSFSSIGSLIEAILANIS